MMKRIIKNIKYASAKIRRFITAFLSRNKRKMFKTFLSVIICLSVIALIFPVVRNFTKLSRYFTKDNESGELFKVCLTVVGGAGAFVALYYSARRVRAMEKGNADTRFNNAVGHLGNANPTVVLGGIHALHQIAVKYESYTQVVHNLFCSYLRENSAKLYAAAEIKKTPDKSPLIIPTSYKKTEIETASDKCPVIIQTLIDYLFKPYNNKDSVYKNYESDLSFGTLKNVDLENVKLNKVNFANCLLIKCNFSGGTLTECYFLGGTLTKCKFWGGILTKCYFLEGTLEDCNFWRGTLTKCNFTVGTLKKCDFWSVTFTECDFSKVALTKCNFTGGTLKKCNFWGGTFTECKFIYKELDGKYNAKLFDCYVDSVKLIGTEYPPNETNNIR